MVVLHRANGMRVVSFPDDHEPAHVHVFGDGQAKINLVGSDGRPELIWAVGMKRSDVRRALAMVWEQRTSLLNSWKNIHG